MPVMRATAQQIGLFISAYLIVSYTYAYGPLGHEIVGKIAESHLCDQATEEVARLLQGESLGRASRWPDWIRKDPQWRKSRAWHYINVADNARVEDALGQSGGDVVWAIENFRGELENRELDLSKRKEALSFLAHFIADVHQPLHVGRREDRGGNSIIVIVDGQETNLHRFWDAQQLLKLDQGDRRYDRDGQVASIRALASDRVADLQSAGVLDWARESQALRPEVYGFDVASGVLDAKYRAAALEITRARLAAAGVRLAGTLNDIFCAVPGPG